MPITVNEGGVLYEANNIYVNEGGVLYDLSGVSVNEGGVLHEVFASRKIPDSLSWSVNSSDSEAKINSISNNGYNINYTAFSLSSSGGVVKNSLFCSVKLYAGMTVSFKATGTTQASSLVAVLGVDNQYLQSTGSTQSLTISEDGIYFLALRGFGVTGSQSGVNYYSATVSAVITITDG